MGGVDALGLFWRGTEEVHICNPLLWLGLCSFLAPKFGFVFHFFIAHSLSFPAQTDIACRSQGAVTGFYQLRTFPPSASLAVFRLPSGKTRGATQPLYYWRYLRV
jgi:hypothetical protein